MWSVMATGETLVRESQQLNIFVPLPRAQVLPYVFLALLAVAAVGSGCDRLATNYATAI